MLDATTLRGDHRLTHEQIRMAWELGRRHVADGVRPFYDPSSVWALVVAEPRDDYCPGSGYELLTAYLDGVRSADRP